VQLSAQAVGRRDARDNEADREAVAGARALHQMAYPSTVVARRTTEVVILRLIPY
jgi:hypothetical protein